MDIQIYAGTATPTLNEPTKTMCPGPSGGNNFWPSSYSVKTKLIYIPTATPCVDLTQKPEMSNAKQRLEGRRLQADRALRVRTDRRRSASPARSETHTRALSELQRHADHGGRAGVHRFTDGTFAAYDDTTLEQLWKINVGTGFNAPPMTFAVNGKQYVAILSGLSNIARGKHLLIPELKEQRNQTMLFVFAL